MAATIEQLLKILIHIEIIKLEQKSLSTSERKKIREIDKLL